MKGQTLCIEKICIILVSCDYVEIKRLTECTCYTCKIFTGHNLHHFNAVALYIDFPVACWFEFYFQHWYFSKISVLSSC